MSKEKKGEIKNKKDDEIKRLKERIKELEKSEIKRKKLEEALKESKEQYRAVVENSQNGILIVGKDYKVIYVNDRLCEILGYTREEIIGSNFKEFLDEESIELVTERFIRRQRREIVPSKYKFNIVRKDGEKRHIEISSTVVKDSKGKIKTIAQILDITENKLAEEIISTQAEVTKNMAEGAYIIGLHDVIIRWANPRFESMFGYEPGEMIGRHASIVNAPTDKSPEESAEEIMEVLRSKGEWHGEVNNIMKDGTSFWCYASVSVFTHPEYGEVLLSVHSDITERKHAEEELKKNQEHLEELVKERTKELEEKNKELNRFNKLFVGREFRIKELKDKVKELEKELRRKK